MNPEASQNPSWWQVGAGIVPILVALVGIIYTWFLIQKTNLEARKLRLEIVEKESAALATLSSKPPLVVVEGFSLSNVQRALLAAFVVFNLAVMLVYGFKMRPLYGVEVLAVALGAASCACALGVYVLVRVLHVIQALMSIDNAVINTMAKAFGVRSGNQEEPVEQ